MFEVKGAYLAVMRVGRGLLRRGALTPARFDLLYALGTDGMRQCELWRQLNVVRSVVCEMVKAIEALGWVRRTRDLDRRTWLVELTRAGSEVFEQARRRWVESGNVTLFIDEALTNRDVEVDAVAQRVELIRACDLLSTKFRTRRKFNGPDLYPWRREDFWYWFANVGDPVFPGDVPFVA